MKPFGYVLKSKDAKTPYPWCNPYRWSDKRGSCGNFRANLCDAIVFKRLKSAQNYSSLEVVPVWKDPVKHGEPALVKPVTFSQVEKTAMVGGNEKEITKIIHGGAVKQWVGIGWVTEGVASFFDKCKYPEVVEA